jgi:hypothetical protein
LSTRRLNIFLNFNFNCRLVLSSEFRLSGSGIKEFIHLVCFRWYCAKCRKWIPVLFRLGSNRLDHLHNSIL